MSRSLSNLRRVLFGVSCAIVFGFGATEALAGPPGPGGLWPTNPYPSGCVLSDPMANQNCSNYCGWYGADGVCTSEPGEIWYGYCECY
jgi:hypothetical protein